MKSLYPFKFKPIYRDKIWGGQKIKSSLGMDFGELPNCGEAWLISGYEGFETIAENGFLQGNNINELVEIFMGDLVGDAVYDEFGDEFPLLIKIIDASDWLSIQVHPDDKLAAKRKIGFGKTEMWYVLDADPGSELISGFNREIDQESYVKHLEEGSIKDIMNFEQVKKGDVFYMPAGRVHAIGPGSLLAEIQQTSDNTFRIYDWDRIDAAGLKRELHTDEALEAMDYAYHQEVKTAYQEELNKTSPIVDEEKFTTNVLSFNEPVSKDYEELDSFVVYLCIEGKINLEWEDGKIELIPGDAVLKPAILRSIGLFPDTSSKLLEVYIKPSL